MSKKCEDSQVFGLGMVLSSRVQLSYYVGRLSKLVQMKGTFYPKLVKVFYTYEHADLEGNLFCTINGVEMVIDEVEVENQRKWTSDTRTLVSITCRT